MHFDELVHMAWPTDLSGLTIVNFALVAMTFAFVFGLVTLLRRRVPAFVWMLPIAAVGVAGALAARSAYTATFDALSRATPDIIERALPDAAAAMNMGPLLACVVLIVALNVLAWAASLGALAAWARSESKLHLGSLVIGLLGPGLAAIVAVLVAVFGHVPVLFLVAAGLIGCALPLALVSAMLPTQPDFELLLDGDKEAKAQKRALGAVIGARSAAWIAFAIIGLLAVPMAAYAGQYELYRAVALAPPDQVESMHMFGAVRVTWAVGLASAVAGLSVLIGLLYAVLPGKRAFTSGRVLGTLALGLPVGVLAASLGYGASLPGAAMDAVTVTPIDVPRELTLIGGPPTVRGAGPKLRERFPQSRVLAYKGGAWRTIEAEVTGIEREPLSDADRRQLDLMQGLETEVTVLLPADAESTVLLGGPDVLRGRVTVVVDADGKAAPDDGRRHVVEFVPGFELYDSRGVVLLPSGTLYAPTGDLWGPVDPARVPEASVSMVEGVPASVLLEVCTHVRCALGEVVPAERAIELGIAEE